jgi:hypothetical protein
MKKTINIKKSPKTITIKYVIAWIEPLVDIWNYVFYLKHFMHQNLQCYISIQSHIVNVNMPWMCKIIW